MADLVALDLPLGPRMVDEIRRAYDRGDAVCVVDQRLEPGRQSDLLSIMAPTRILSDDESRAYGAGRPVEPGDGAVVVTSGSSGRPKAAILTWAALIASAEMTSRALARSEPTRWNACLPPTHIGGFAVLLRSIFAEDRLVWGDRERLNDGPALGATHVAVVRTQLARFDLADYAVVLLGGSRAPEDLADNVVTTWGMTETGSGVVYNQRALEGVEIAVIDDEILVRSPTLLRTYREGPAPVVTGPDGRSDWFPTGDEGSLRDGILSVHGRRGHVIVTGGEKVWPDDLEAALALVEGIDDVAVGAREDSEWGERVIALVVSSRSREELAEPVAQAATRAIGPWAKPKEIVYVTSIPRTTNGKVARGALSAMLQPTPPLG